MTQGTPKTLAQAIQNGIAQFHDPKAYPNSVEMSVEQCIELHVRDYLAQFFGAAMMRDESNEESLKRLFDRIFTKEVA